MPAQLLTTVAAALLLTACSSPPSTPEATLEAFYHALGNKDSATACSLVAYAGIPLSGDDVALCRNGFDTVVQQVASAAELGQLRAAKVTGSVVSGTTATVRPDQITDLPEAFRSGAELVLVGDRWYLDTPR